MNGIGNSLGLEHLKILWCLLGCLISSFVKIACFKFIKIDWPVSLIMILGIINGIFISIILETINLSQQMLFQLDFKTAISMYIVLIISVEAAMGLIDFILITEAIQI